MFLPIKTSSEYPVSAASAMEKKDVVLVFRLVVVVQFPDDVFDDVCGHFQVPDASVKLLPCRVGVVTVDLLFLNLA